MYVCVCHKVTDRDILEAAKQGIDTLDDLGQQLKVATCCGRCSDCARSLLHEEVSRNRCDNNVLKVA